ncbi:hypothetical protein [Bacillus phage PK2]|nr:hypothetical protein [Bacillus phage PK2]
MREGKTLRSLEDFLWVNVTVIVLRFCFTFRITVLIVVLNFISKFPFNVETSVLKVNPHLVRVLDVKSFLEEVFLDFQTFTFVESFFVSSFELQDWRQFVSCLCSFTLTFQCESVVVQVLLIFFNIVHELTTLTIRHVDITNHFHVEVIESKQETS